MIHNTAAVEILIEVGGVGMEAAMHPAVPEDKLSSEGEEEEGEEKE